MRLPTRKKELENNQLRGDDGPVYLTKAGIEKLEYQLVDLEKQHKQAVKDVQTTGEFGDFSENAEYQEAKHRMRNLSLRITILKERLKSAVVIEKDEQYADRVQLGSRVKLQMNDRILILEIVGPQEANPMRGRISHLSPLGSHLIGHTVGEHISVVTEGDELIYQILEVH
jgi:transcription elongation factor GreA